MEALFLKLVNMSITASWLVLAVLIFRVVLKKAPKYIRVILWGLVGLRLVLPFSFESILSLIPSKETLPQEFLYAATPQINSGIPAVNNVLNPVIAESMTPVGLTSANPTQIWSFIFSRLWLLGVILMTVYALISYLMIRRKVAAFIPVGKHIRLCDHIDTPFILGIFRPKIYLPSSLDQATMDHVLAHEQAHLTRHDHWWKPLGFALLAVYWFNPVMWVAYILLCRDIEMACDEKVVKELGSEEKKAYSTALLRCSIPKRMIAACPLAFGEVGVKSRIKSVLNYKKPAFWIIVVAVVACIAVAVCFLTDPAEQTSPYIITRNLEKESIGRVQVTLWEQNQKHISLTDGQVEKLVQILNELEEKEFEPNSPVDHNISVMILMGEKAVALQYDGERVEFVLDSETAEEVDGNHWSVRNEALNEFISQFDRVSESENEERLAVGSYVCPECVYWPSYFSTLRPDHGPYNFLVYEDRISYYSSSSGKVTEEYAVDWQWKPLTQCYEDVFFYVEWYEEFAAELSLDVPVPSETTLYQTLDNNHMLIKCDGIMYMVEGTAQGKNAVLTYVDAIYQVGRIELTSGLSGEETNDEISIPVTYPDSTDADEINNLYSTISGQIYDSRDGQDMLIRNAILEHHGISGDVKNFESHQILSEMLGCGAETEDGSPVGFTVVDVIAVVMNAAQADTRAGFTAKSNIISATISIDRYADGTLKLTEYQENTVEDLSDYDLTPLMQHCYDQAVKYWGMNTDLMVDSLLDTVSSSPLQYSNAQPYIEAHQEEFDRIVYLGEYTLNYCFDAFLNNHASGIRAEIMAAACREIGASMGEEISFDGQYLNASTWFDAFWTNALELYDAHGLDALAESNRASWVLLNILGQTPVPASVESTSIQR